jgi:hypothetical protein
MVVNNLGRIAVFGDSAPVFPRKGAGPWLAWLPSGFGVTFGCSGGYTSAGNGSLSIAGGKVPVVQLNDSQSNGTGIYFAGNCFAALASSVYFKCRANFKVLANQGSRTWLGMTFNVNPYEASDTPIADGVAFRFSTAMDTTYKACAFGSQGAGNSVVVDTGIAPDGAFHDFEIYFDTVNVNFAIDDVIVAQIPILGYTSPGGWYFISSQWTPFMALKGLVPQPFAQSSFQYMYMEFPPLS